MQSVSGRRAVAGVFHLSWLLVLLGLLLPGSASAQSSIYCPMPLTATVAWGGSVVVDVTACQSGFAGVSGPIPPFAQHGTVTLGPGTGGPQSLTYAHNATTPDGGGIDTIWLEDDELETVRVDITISAPTSAIVVSPATLPTLTAGTPFSQALSSSGGTAPYTYALESGPLPVGLSLTSAGVLSGTPTQRGNYSFSVRSTDSTTPTGETVVKSYTGTVQNPTLSLDTPGGTAIQGVAFSQALSTTGGVAPHSYQVESGTLPAGITISSAGLVSGTTNAAPGSYPVTLRVTDSSTGTGPYFELETYTLTVSTAPALSVNDVTANEGDAGLTGFTFTVSLSAPAGPGGASFDIATADGTAVAGSDYVASSLTGQTIPAGSSAYTFTVQVNGDTTNEADEIFFVNVTNVSGAVATDSQGQGRILNDDPLPSLGISDASVVEGNAGTTSAVFTVSLGAPSGQAVSVDYATADGTATAPSDYIAQTGTLTFAAGQTSRTVSVVVNGDIVPEDDETFFVNLSGAVNAAIVDAQGVGTIGNDDVPVNVSPLTLPDGAVAVAYSQTVSATGGAAPYTFSITAGALPPGLVLAAGGTLSGTPTAGGTFNFTVTATDSSPAPGPFSASRAYSLVITAAVVELPATTLPPATVGQSYAASLAPATGGTAPYSYALVAGSLPAGLTFSTDGTFSGTPTAPGTFNFTITATDSSTGTGPYQGTRSYTLAVTDPTPVANDSTLSVAYGAPATAVPLNLSGGPPDTLAIAAAPTHGTAQVSGLTITYQPAAGYAGVDSFTYTATNGGGTSAPATVTVTVADAIVTVTASGPLAATIALPYSQTFTFNGGAAPWSGYQVDNLPAGLAITASDTGSVTISGTPSEAGNFALQVSATDSSSGNGPFTAAQTFTLTVGTPTLALSPAAGTLDASYAAAYSQAFAASGGVGPYTYALAGALPAGMAFSDGTLAGTPTEPGSYAITVTATDTGSTGAGAPFTTSQAYTLVVAAPSLAIAPATLPDALAGTAYAQTLTASGGVAPYAFAVTAGALPAGLTLTADGGLSGTATAAGTFNLTVTATDANGQSVAQAYALVVDSPTLALSPAAGTLDASYAAAYSQAFAASGGVGPYTYALAGALPAGMAFSDGTLAGTPTEPGSYAITVTATDTGSTGAGAPFTTSQAYTLVVAAPSLAIAPATLPDALAGTAYAQTLTASGGVAPYAFAVTAGALPAGLTLTADGGLSGTATAAGTFNLTVTATDANGQSVAQAYALAVDSPTLVLTPATGALPGAIAGVAYSQRLQVQGGIAPYAATLDGDLPAGLAFDGDSLTLAGTATETGSFAITITVTDSTRGTPATASASFTLAVAAASLALTPDALPDATGGVAYTQTFSASGGVAPYAYRVDGSLPAGLTLDASSGALAGTPTEAGSFAFAITATDSTSGTPGTITADYVLAVAAPVIVIDPDTLPEALLGVDYAQPLSARGGTAPYTFTMEAGALPAGILLADDGVLAGLPGEGGTFNVTVRATDALGFSGTRAYALNVIARPDPTRDPEVRGLLDAQAAATRRFATSQIANFQQRLQQLHGRGDAGGARNGLALSTREQCPDNRFYPIEHACNPANRARARQPLADDGLQSAPAQPGDGPAGTRAYGVWTSGTLRSGSFDGQAGGRGFDFETEGVSAGVDARLFPDLVVGAGLGYGQDSTTVGGNGSHLRGKAWTMALYGSFQPDEALFVDALVGYQRLSFDLERYLGATGGFVQGTRDGDQLLGSIAVGADLVRQAWTFTPYARLDAMRGALAGYTEQGGGALALAYGEQDVDTTTGNLGLTTSFRHDTRWGSFSPQLRVEYQHDFTAAGGASMRYADGIGPVYFTAVDGFDRRRVMIGLGVLFDLGRYSIQVDYRGVAGSGEQRDNAVQLMFQSGR